MIVNNFPITYQPVPSKKDIIQRLFEQGHISFDEMWTLLLEDPTTKYIPMPTSPMNPFQDPYNNPQVLYDTSNRELHNSTGGDPASKSS